MPCPLINPAVQMDLSQTMVWTGVNRFMRTDHVVIPSGTTGQRPTPLVGSTRINTTTGRLEYSVDGATWTDLDVANYVLLNGRAGGQLVYGGTAAGEDLDLDSTIDPTKGNVRLPRSTPSGPLPGGAWVVDNWLRFRDNAGTPATHRVVQDFEHLDQAGYLEAPGSTGRIYIAGTKVWNPAFTGAIPSADTLIALPIVIPRSRTLAGLGFNVTSIGGGGSLTMVGLYSNTSETTLYPNVLVASGTVFNTSALTGLLETPSLAALSPGLYWMVYWTSAATPNVTVTCCPAIGQTVSMWTVLGLGIAFTTASAGYGWTSPLLFTGTLPPTFPGGGSVLGTGALPFPLMSLRFSA